jgi:putative membrane protein insertion efficiency factor
MCQFCSLNHDHDEDEGGAAPAPRKNPLQRSRNYAGPFRKTPDRLLGMGLIRLYQLTLSGFIGNSCRHIPTCSEYGYEAVARHGLWSGGWMTLFPCRPLRPWRHQRFRSGAGRTRRALALVDAVALPHCRPQDRMTTYVALLHSIVLAPGRRVVMSDLRDMASSLGYQNPRTLVSTGNIVFETHRDTGR